MREKSKSKVLFIFFVGLFFIGNSLKAQALVLECHGTIINPRGATSVLDINIPLKNADEQAVSVGVYVHGDEESFSGMANFSITGDWLQGNGKLESAKSLEVVVNAEIFLDRKDLTKAKANFNAINYVDEKRSKIEIEYKYSNVVLVCKVK